MNSEEARALVERQARAWKRAAESVFAAVTDVQVVVARVLRLTS